MRIMTCLAGITAIVLGAMLNQIAEEFSFKLLGSFLCTLGGALVIGAVLI